MAPIPHTQMNRIIIDEVEVLCASFRVRSRTLPESFPSDLQIVYNTFRQDVDKKKNAIHVYILPFSWLQTLQWLCSRVVGGRDFWLFLSVAAAEYILCTYLEYHE